MIIAEKLDPKELVPIEELAISSMWEIAALVEVSERKGICKKQDLYDANQDLRRKNANAVIPEEMLPEPYVLTEIENQLMQQILDLFNEKGLTAQQAKNLLGRLGLLIDLGDKLAKKTTH